MGRISAVGEGVKYMKAFTTKSGMLTTTEHITNRPAHVSTSAEFHLNTLMSKFVKSSNFKAKDRLQPFSTGTVCRGYSAALLEEET